MKKLLLVVALLLIAFAVYARNRLYVRDPLAHVTHNGVQEQGAQVYINFPSEVLIENDKPPMYALLLQHGNHVGIPATLHCLHYMVCLTDADVATLAAPAANLTVDSMTAREVRFHSDSETIVTLY